MNKIILDTLFRGKDSLYSPKLALSTADNDYSYADIAGRIDAIGGFISDTFHVKSGGRVVVCCKSPAELVMLVLALIKLKVALVMVDSDRPEDLANVVLAENPDLVLTSLIVDQAAYPSSCAVHNFTGREASARPAASGDFDPRLIAAGFEFGFYKAGNPVKQVISAPSVLQAFAEIGKFIQPECKGRVLMTTDVELLPVLIESLWCVFNALHVLYYPPAFPGTVFPGKEHFPMDFSLFFFGNSVDNPEDQQSCYDLVMKSAAHADRHGYTAVWTPERHFNEFGGKFPNPGILAAAIAMRTSKVQIRTGSIVAPLHHVVRIAEDWSVIDNLSDGRAALSFASGWQCNDFVFYPDRYAKRHEIMLQLIEDFRKLWAGESMEFNNGVGSKIKIRIYPKPVQKEMPVWVTVSGKTETFTDAGRIGANILTHLLWQDPADLIEKIQAYRTSLRDNGFDPRSRVVSVMLHTFVGPDIQEVKRKVEKPLKEYIRSSLQLVETMTATVRDTKGNNAIGRYGKNDQEVPEHLKNELLDLAFERFFTSASLLGDPHHCREILKKLRSYGVDELACLIDFGLGTQDILQGLEHLQQLKEEYSEKNTKSYEGPFVLRTTGKTLHDLLRKDPEKTSMFNKVIVDAGSAKREGGNLRSEIHFSYHPGQPAELLTGSLDASFELQKARLYELHLAQANEKIVEDF